MMPHLFIELCPSKSLEVTSMLTCRPSPYVSVTWTLSASSASCILSCMLCMSSDDIRLCSSDTDSGVSSKVFSGPLICTRESTSQHHLV